MTAFNGGTKEDGVTPWDADDGGNGRLDLTKAALAGLVMDETTQHYIDANPNTGGDPKTLNIPALRNMDCTPNCTWTRTVRNTRNVATSWRASGTAITPGFDIEVSPSSFTFGGGLGETQKLTIIATPTTDLTGAVAFGEVALHETGGISHERITVAIKGLPGGGGDLTLVSAASSKKQGNAGTFDIDLPLDGSGVECRQGALGTATYIVFTFSDTVNSVDSTSTSCGRVISTTADGSTVTVLLKDIQTTCDASDVTVTLTGVNGDTGTLASAAVTFGQLAGDVNGDGTVDGTDLQSVRANSGAGLVTDANFRNDVSGDGKVNHADISLTRAARGNSLP